MSPYYHYLFVDKTTITTSFRPHPELRTDPAAFARERNRPVLFVKQSHARSNGRPTWILKLKLTNYKGITVTLKQGYHEPLATATIDFNPGRCLYGHNGRILLLTEFFDALGLLVTNLRPLLLDPDDWIDLVPGLRRGGPAYWSYLEILFQVRDPGGVLLAQQRHLRHPSIRTPSRHWPDSMDVGGKRSKLRLSIYRKAVEMASRSIGKVPLLSDAKLAEDRDILRLEARLKEEKLVEYLGNGRNVEVIDGKERLVWFWPQDLVGGLSACFSKSQGVFSTVEQPKDEHPCLAALGRMIADVASDDRVTLTCPQLFDLIKIYTGAESETIRKIRKASFDEMSRRSSINRDDLISATAFAAPVGIASEVAESLIFHEFNDTVAPRLIIKIYRPPGQPFHPHTELPMYTLRRNPDEDTNHENDR